METYKTGVAFPLGFGGSLGDTARDARAAGFETAALTWRFDRTGFAEDAAVVRAASLTATSVHTPFSAGSARPHGVNALWEDGEEGDAFADILMDCAEDCAAARIPVMVAHVTLGNAPPHVSERGIERWARIGAHASALGVRIALETMESAPHVRALADALDTSVFGICYDAGHAQAYTPHEDWLTDYAGRIFAVHLHDNPGKTAPGLPDTRDDTHYLPYDGVRDWRAAMHALARARYRGALTLEIRRGRAVCPQRPDYAALGQRAFLDEAYRRARRLGEEFARAAEFYKRIRNTDGAAPSET